MTYNQMDEVYRVLTKVCDSMIDRMFIPAGMDVGDFGLFISRKKNAYGYCYVQPNWTVKDTGIREIGLTPDGLVRGELAVCTTLAHELVHAYNATQGIRDVNGQRHNKKFKAGCDRIGLGCENVSSTYGYMTDVSYNSENCNRMFDCILSVLTDSERALLNDLKSILEGEAPKKKNRNLAVHQCPACGAKARASPTTSLICGECMVQMEVH